MRDDPDDIDTEHPPMSAYEQAQPPAVEMRDTGPTKPPPKTNPRTRLLCNRTIMEFCYDDLCHILFGHTITKLMLSDDEAQLILDEYARAKETEKKPSIMKSMSGRKPLYWLDQETNEFLSNNVVIYHSGMCQWFRYDSGVWEKVSEESIQQKVFQQLGGASTLKDRRELIASVKMHDVVFRDDSTKFDAKPILTLKNCAINLDTLDVVPWSPDNLCTKRIPINYDPYLFPACDRWLQHVESTLVPVKTDEERKKPDPLEMTNADILCEWFGNNLLVHKAIYRKSLFIVGPTSSGKSVIANVLISMLSNKNKTSVDWGVLGTRFGVETMGEMANIAGDTTGENEDAVMFLRLVDGSDEGEEGGEICVDSKYEKKVDKKICTKMTFCSNFLPKAHGVDGQAFLERVILLPTNDTVPRDKRNPFLLSELALEKDGIFCWALLGLQRLQERKRFAETPSMMEAIEEAEKSSDNVRYFVDTMCELDPTGKFYTDTSDLYAVYHDFCRTNGYRYPAAVVTFSEKIQSVARYIKEKNDKYQVNGKDCKKKIMKGIKLTDDSRMRLDELRKQVGVQTTFHDMK